MLSLHRLVMGRIKPLRFGCTSYVPSAKDFLELFQGTCCLWLLVHLPEAVDDQQKFCVERAKIDPAELTAGELDLFVQLVIEAALRAVFEEAALEQVA